MQGVAILHRVFSVVVFLRCPPVVAFPLLRKHLLFFPFQPIEVVPQNVQVVRQHAQPHIPIKTTYTFICAAVQPMMFLHIDVAFHRRVFPSQPLEPLVALPFLVRPVQLSFFGHDGQCN